MQATLKELSTVHAISVSQLQEARETYKAACDALRAPHDPSVSAATIVRTEAARTGAREDIFDLDLQLEAVSVSARQHLDRLTSEADALLTQLIPNLPPSNAAALKRSIGYLEPVIQTEVQV